MDTTKCAAPAEVRYFCESVSASTAKNITVLKAVEQTVNWLVWIQSSAKADAVFAEKAAEIIKTCERIKPIDVDGTLCVTIEESESALSQFHGLLIAKRESARKAPELNGDHRDAVVTEYTGAISDIADLHNLMADLRWAIGEHDADLEIPSGPAFSGRDDLKAYLETL